MRGDEAGRSFGRYKIIDELGIGGMSTVHLAEVVDDDEAIRLVALKRLLPRAASNDHVKASFLDEARLTRYLDHPNIAKTLDSGKVGPIDYIAMEYIPGPTLKELVQHVGATVGTVPIEIALNVATQVCEGLDHAHNQRDEHGTSLGIIHRDVSPANILVGESGLVKLIDFGLAKAKTSSTETGEGVIKGKFNYVAPEYLGGALDARADLWAIGVVMYELLTSRRLFDAPDDFETMTRVRKMPIPPPSRANPRVGPELDAIVMRALERDPTLRWQSAASLRDALQAEMRRSGTAVDNHHVIEWVNWVFTQEPGTESSGVSMLLSLTDPMPTLAQTTPDHGARSRGIDWLRRMLSRRS
jgi:eukaryotic-like serine/threonine-protein kinase